MSSVRLGGWLFPPARPTPACMPLTTPPLCPQGEVPLVAEHRLVHHGDRGGAVRPCARLWHGAPRLLQVSPSLRDSAQSLPWDGAGAGNLGGVAFKIPCLMASGLLCRAGGSLELPQCTPPFTSASPEFMY